MRKPILYTSLVFVFVFSLFAPMKTAEASFTKSKLIADSVFNQKGSMSAKQINNFLNKFSNSCISPHSGFYAKKPTGYNPTNGFSYGSYVRAGGVIASSAKAYNINPRVLIATLQKEQGLVRGNGPYGCGKLAISASMGYGCPDSGTLHNYSGISLYKRGSKVYKSINGTCVNTKAKAGFTQQIIRAAWLLKFGQQRSKGNVSWAIIRGNWDNSDDPDAYYAGPMTRGNHKRCSSCSKIYYDGYKTIDGQSVLMRTGGTAALYWYTPHFHGNKLFVNIYEGWWGSTSPKCTKSDSAGSDVYRLFSTKKAKHFYTAMECEADVFDTKTSYNIEGVTFQQAPKGDDGRTGVYRLKRKHSRSYFWTSSVDERDNLKHHGYIVEGTAYIGYTKNSTAPNKKPVYRLYNSKTGGHLWTPSANERDHVKSRSNWRLEGVAYYVYKP